VQRARRVELPDARRRLGEGRGQQEVVGLVEGGQAAHVLMAALQRRAVLDAADRSAERRHHQRVEPEALVAGSGAAADVGDRVGRVDEPDAEEVAGQRGVVVGRGDRLDLVAQRLQQPRRLGHRGHRVRVRAAVDRRGGVEPDPQAAGVAADLVEEPSWGIAGA
jgi:hypothetical protein